MGITANDYIWLHQTPATMKKILLATALVAAFAACKKENNTTTPPAQGQVQGEWSGTSLKVFITGLGLVDSADIRYLNFDFQAGGVAKLDSNGTPLPDGAWWQPASNKLGLDGYLPLNLNIPGFPPVTGFPLDSLVLDITTLTAAKMELRKDTAFPFGGTTVPGYVTVGLKK